MQKAHPLIWEALILTSSKTDKVRLRQTSNFQFRVLPLHIRWRGPKIKRDLLATPFQYLFLVYCSVEKLMHQRPNPIHFFFQREMARVGRWSSALGISLLKSSAPSTVKIPSFLPQVISMGGCCLRKYSCQSTKTSRSLFALWRIESWISLLPGRS